MILPVFVFSVVRTQLLLAEAAGTVVSAPAEKLHAVKEKKQKCLK